ncbi:MAG TPA: hypothetical protein VFC63_14240 [Blastocatellia bacterium]|nr:hypothetical protein [Blastocatellia bacterium]
MSTSVIAYSLIILVVFGTYQEVINKQSPYIDQNVAGLTKISPEWIEITPDKPFELIGDVQAVSLHLAEPFLVPEKFLKGVQMPNGLTTIPEVEIVDADGVSLPLKVSEARGYKMIVYGWLNNRNPKGYRSIRIRAKREIQLDAVYWTGYVNKRMP